MYSRPESRDCRTFFPGGCPSRPVPLDWRSLDHYIIPGREDEQAVTVYFEAGALRAIATARRLRLSRFTSTDRARSGGRWPPGAAGLRCAAAGLGGPPSSASLPGDKSKLGIQSSARSTGSPVQSFEAAS